MPDLSRFFKIADSAMFAPAGSSDRDVRKVIIDAPAVDPTIDPDNYNPRPSEPFLPHDVFKAWKLGN